MIQRRPSLYFLKKPNSTSAVILPTMSALPGTMVLDRSGSGTQAILAVALTVAPIVNTNVTVTSSDPSVTVSPSVVVFGPGLPLSANVTVTGSTIGPVNVTLTATPSDLTIAPKTVAITRSTLALPVQTNLAMWLRADSGVIKRGGTNAAVLDDPVQGWQDLSSNALNLSQATLTYQPLYKPTGMNNLPGVTFDGIDDVMTGSDALLPLGKADRTVVMVAKWNMFVAAYGGMSWGSNTTNAVFGMVKWSGTTPPATVQGWAFDYASSYVLTVNTPVLWVVTLSGGLLSQRINRTSVMSNVVSSQNTISANFRMGAETNASGFQGITFSEVVVFNRALTPTEITQMESYAARWNV